MNSIGIRKANELPDLNWPWKYNNELKVRWITTKTDFNINIQIKIDVEVIFDHVTEDELDVEIENGGRQRPRLNISVRWQFAVSHWRMLYQHLLGQQWNNHCWEHSWRSMSWIMNGNILYSNVPYTAYWYRAWLNWRTDLQRYRSIWWNIASSYLKMLHLRKKQRINIMVWKQFNYQNLQEYEFVSLKNASIIRTEATSTFGILHSNRCEFNECDEKICRRLQKIRVWRKRLATGQFHLE